MKDETLFINVVVWGKQGETSAQYLAKGKQVLVEGRLQERSWEAEGVKKSRFEVVAQGVRFLGGRKEEGAPHEAPSAEDFPAPDDTTDLEPF
jgi:single-strand DNA-binding protein